MHGACCAEDVEIPQLQFLFMGFGVLQHIDKVVDVPEMQRSQRKPWEKPTIFHVKVNPDPESHLDAGHYFVLADTDPVFMRTVNGSFWNNFTVSAWIHPAACTWKSGHYLKVQFVRRVEGFFRRF